MSLRQETGSTAAIASSSLSTMMDALGRFFASREITAYLVGGAVRDLLLGRESGDVDVAVSGDAYALGRELSSFLDGRPVVLDEERGIVRVVLPGNGGCVDLTSISDGIEEDLRRRDFTVDAMAVPLERAGHAHIIEGLVDPRGGLPDLREGVIRAVDPGAFQADPARLLRAPRLSAQLGFRIAEDTSKQIRRYSALVVAVAPERVRDELLKMLAEPGATPTLRALDDLGLLCRVIPELSDARGVSQPAEHRWDVFEHLVETPGQVEKVLSGHSDGDGFDAEMVPRFERMGEYFTREVGGGHTRLTLLKVAGMLHDIAKPATRTVEPSGRIRFLGHHAQGADVAENILERLRLSGKEIVLVRSMVRSHLRPSQMARDGELPTAKAIYRYYRDVGDAAIDTLYLNMADYLAARGPMLGRREWSEHCRVIGRILREGLEGNTPEMLPKLINGHDIMKVFSMSPGPRVGWLIGLVHEAQAAGEITTRDEALELVGAALDPEGDRA